MVDLPEPQQEKVAGLQNHDVIFICLELDVCDECGYFIMRGLPPTSQLQTTFFISDNYRPEYIKTSTFMLRFLTNGSMFERKM